MLRTFHDTAMSFPIMLLVDPYGDMALVMNTATFRRRDADVWVEAQNELIARGEEVSRGVAATLYLAS